MNVVQSAVLNVRAALSALKMDPGRASVAWEGGRATVRVSIPGGQARRLTDELKGTLKRIAIPVHVVEITTMEDKEAL